MLKSTETDAKGRLAPKWGFLSYILLFGRTEGDLSEKDSRTFWRKWTLRSAHLSICCIIVLMRRQSVLVFIILLICEVYLLVKFFKLQTPNLLSINVTKIYVYMIFTQVFFFLPKYNENNQNKNKNIIVINNKDKQQRDWWVVSNNTIFFLPYIPLSKKQFVWISLFSHVKKKGTNYHHYFNNVLRILGNAIRHEEIIMWQCWIRRKYYFQILCIWKANLVYHKTIRNFKVKY